MKKTIAAIIAVLLAVGIGLVGVSTANAAACNPSAGVSDSCTTPYTVTTTTLTLPAGHSFQASGDTNEGNIKYIPISQYQAGQTYLSNTGWTVLNINFHIEGTNPNTGTAMIGQTVLPFNSTLSDGAFKGTLPASGYCIVWVQVGGFNEHFGEGGQAPICTTIPKDASAAVSATSATCNSPQTLALGTIANATWGTVTGGTGPGSYSVVATATAGHQFSDGSTTKTFTGPLTDKSTTGCSTTPGCVSDITWTYTYNGTNAGTITAVSRAHPTTTGLVLCTPLYVRATSWDYVLPADGNSPSWPQTLHGYNDLTVSSTGTYNYAAPVIQQCRQYDIYASFVGYSDLKVPTQLNGPGTPYEPNFLHGVLVAPAGPNPTYSDDASTPCNVIQPAAVLISGQCYWDTTLQASLKTVSLEFNNNASNIPVTFTVDNHAGYTTTVAAGDVKYITVPASSTTGVTYTAHANGQTFVLSVGQFADCAPTITACTTQVSTILSTNLAVNGWDYSNTRANGHYEYVSNALHISTDGSTDVVAGVNTDQSAGSYHPGTAIPLSQLGTPSMSYTNTSGSLPTIQLAIDTNGDGIADATLVYQAGLGTNGATLTAADTATGKWWATADLGVNSNGAPNPTVQKSWGTLTDYLKHYPTAKIIAVGYSLGAGAQGNGLVKSISAGCDKFTFDYTPIPVTTIAAVTFLDVCGTAGDQVNIPVAPVSYHYETVDNRVAGVGTVTVTAVANPGYTLDVTQQSVFPFTFQNDSNLHCTSVPHDPFGSAQTCDAAAPHATISGFITVVQGDHLTYTIHNEADGASTANDITGIVTGDTKVALGTYDVTAIPDAGWTLTSSPATTVVKITNNTINCQLPDHAAFTPAATGVDPVCSGGVSSSGYIQITLGDGLNYTVNGTQLTAAQTAFVPGTYSVVATLVQPVGNTILGTNPITVVIHGLTAACSSLKTLAFTGGGGPSGILIGSAILLLLGGVLVFTRRTPEGLHRA